MCTYVYPVVLDLGLHWIMHKGIYVSQRQHLHTSLIKSNAPYRSDTRKEKKNKTTEKQHKESNGQISYSLIQVTILTIAASKQF